MDGFRQFCDRQADLRRRLSRLPARTLVRRRLERELRGLVLEELQQELEVVPRPARQNEPLVSRPDHWLQRWEKQQDSQQ